jgi:selenocysteine lyase/cysteine desulfurase
VCVDGVAYAPHRSVDVTAWDVDYYAFSAYKVFGPHCAVLYGKRALLAELDSINHFFVGRDDVPYKLQPGSFSYEAAYATTGITDYLADLAARAGADGAPSADAAQAALAAHEETLAERLLTFLSQRPGVRVIGSPTADRRVRVPTISFVVDGRQSAEIVTAVDACRIGIRHGHFYAKRLIDALGLAAHGGVVRVSMVHYNTLDEVDRLVACLDAVL